MIWTIFQQVGFLVFLIFTIYFVYKKKYESLVALYFWGIGFASCFVFLLTIWTPAKIVSLGMMWCLLFHRKVRHFVQGSTSKPLFIFLLVILFVSNGVALVTPKPITTFANPYMRIVLQDFGYLTNGSLLIFGLLLKPGFLQRIFPRYCFAVEIAVFIGLIHFFCIKTGIGFMPILRTAAHDQLGNDAYSVVASFGGIEQVRIYGFAGEPKGLGFFVAPYVASSIFCYLQGYYRRNNKFYHLLMLILAIFVLYNTFSSSALIALFLVIPIVFLSSSLKIKASHIVLTIGLLIVGLIVNLKPSDGVSFTDSMYERTFGRGEIELENDRQETQVLDQYKKEGLGYQIFGWGIGQYTFHVAGQAFDKTLRTLQSGAVLALADFGIFGVIFYLCLTFILFRFLRRSRSRMPREFTAFTIITATSFIGSLMYGSFLTSAIFFMILFSSTDYINNYEKR